MRSFGVLGRLGVVVLTVALLAVAAPAGAADSFTPGSPGLGDPFFPLAGNGGYDVTNYAAAPLRARNQPPGWDGDHPRHRHPEPVAV